MFPLILQKHFKPYTKRLPEGSLFFWGHIKKVNSTCKSWILTQDPGIISIIITGIRRS